MATTPIDFLKALFAHTTEMIYICSFSNERNDPRQAGERHVATRTPAHITSFIQKWNKPGRGLFFCVGTVKAGAKRNKENIEETICLHIDIDFAKIEGDPDLAEVMGKLARIKFLPSASAFSGNGVHAYWLFKEPLETQGNIERIEMALRQLADHLGGDLPVCEVSRVLRVPGSHNTKGGAWTEVEITSFDPDRRYELDDLEEWLSEASPVMLRKNREHAKTVGESNDGDDFFAEYARLHDIKPPIDVEARLNAMVYMGGGDSSIHQTQLQCSASMLSQGMAQGEVVAILLAATKRAAGEYGARWNWRREERNIIKMCDDWIKKHPLTEKKPRSELKSIEGGLNELRKEQQQQGDQQKATGGGQVITMVPPTKAAPALGKKSEQHVALGSAVLAHIRAQGEELINTKEGTWFYSKGIWDLRIDAKWLDVRIETACRGLSFKSGTKLINETRNWIIRNPELWREGDLPWDQHGKVPTRSGLIDPLTGELERARPDHFCTWRIEVDYDPAARCPWWETMVADVFGDKGEVEQPALVRVVQEVLGAALIDRKPRQLSKALVFWGISNQGKSGFLEVFTGLFGGKVISAAIGSVDATHGLMPFTRRLPWVLHEAFGGQWHFSSNVKAIITHEPVMINVKNGPMLSQVIRAPVFWATNWQPQFKEATKAIVNRMIVIECTRVFEDADPIGIALEAKRRKLAKPSDVVLTDELPGLLNWALAGLKRALERGTIELTASINETAETIRRDSNLVAGFLDDCVEYDPLARVRVADFCLAHSAWWMELKGEDRRLPTNEAIGKALKAIGDGRIGADRKEMRDTHARYYCGIALNTAGLRYHKTAFESRMFEGKVATATPPDRDVNSLIPPSWDERASMTAMRKRHEAQRSSSVIDEKRSYDQ